MFNQNIYSNLADDVNDSYGVSYALSKTLSFDAGYTRGWRINFPSSGSPTNPNPTVYSGAYLAAAWQFGPNTRIGKPFTIFATGVDVDHQLNAVAHAALPGGLAQSVPGWEILCSSCGMTIKVPIGYQTFIVPSAPTSALFVRKHLRDISRAPRSAEITSS